MCISVNDKNRPNIRPALYSSRRDIENRKHSVPKWTSGCRRLEIYATPGLEVRMMRYLMTDAGKVHANPDPSQSSTPEVSFPVPETPMPKSRLVRHTTFGAIRIQTKLVIQQHCVLHGKGKALIHWPRAPLFPAHTHTHTHTQVNHAEGIASFRGRSFVSWRHHLGWAHCTDRSAHPFRIFWLTMVTPTHSSNTIWYVVVFFNSLFRLSSLKSMIF